MNEQDAIFQPKIQHIFLENGQSLPIVMYPEVRTFLELIRLMNSTPVLVRKPVTVLNSIDGYKLESKTPLTVLLTHGHRSNSGDHVILGRNISSAFLYQKLKSTLEFLHQPPLDLFISCDDHSSIPRWDQDSDNPILGIAGVTNIFGYNKGTVIIYLDSMMSQYGLKDPFSGISSSKIELVNSKFTRNQYQI